MDLGLSKNGNEEDCEKEKVMGLMVMVLLVNRRRERRDTMLVTEEQAMDSLYIYICI